MDALTPTQTEALRTVHEMATSYLVDVTCGEKMFYADDSEIDSMDDAIEIAGKLIDDLNSGRVKLVNSQE